jgi:hypothetical protein
VSYLDLARSLARRLRSTGCSELVEPLEADDSRATAEAAPASSQLLDALGGVRAAKPSLLVAEVCAMRLDDFARAGLVVTVRSELLGERIILASDNARVDPGELRTVYRARELRALLGLTDPGELRQIHAVKRTFRGSIADTP